MESIAAFTWDNAELASGPPTGINNVHPTVRTEFVCRDAGEFSN